MIITKGEEPHTKQQSKQEGKLEYKTVYQIHAISQTNEYMSTNHVMTCKQYTKTQTRLIQIYIT